LGDSVGDSLLPDTRKSIMGNSSYFVFRGIMHRPLFLGRMRSRDWRLPQRHPYFECRIISDA
jgi:hypothetical protein